MSLTIKTRKVDGITVVDMSGRLTIGEPGLHLRDNIRGFVDDGDLRFILNLGKVSYIDSSGLGELVTTYTSLQNRDGAVTGWRLYVGLHATPRVRTRTGGRVPTDRRRSGFCT